MYSVYIQKAGDVLQIIIKNQSEEPIYAQIFEQIKQAILTHVLAPHEPLPSIRHLAKDLKVSVITTKRAYEELERNGFIYTQKGKGSFVQQINDTLVKEEHMKRIEAHLIEAIDLAKVIDFDRKSLHDMLDILSEDL